MVLGAPPTEIRGNLGCEGPKPGICQCLLVVRLGEAGGQVSNILSVERPLSFMPALPLQDAKSMLRWWVGRGGMFCISGELKIYQGSKGEWIGSFARQDMGNLVPRLPQFMTEALSAPFCFDFFCRPSRRSRGFRQWKIPQGIVTRRGGTSGLLFTSQELCATCSPVSWSEYLRLRVLL